MKYEIIKKRLIEKYIEDEEVSQLVSEFTRICEPYEEKIYLHVDTKNNSIYCECHISASKLIVLGTTDVPIDPDEQPEYRANRELVEDHIAFDQMKKDAKDKRTFSNIVTEFDTINNPEFPIKIIGGQHRFLAIKEAFENQIDELHGIKTYFGLNKDQRLDVQLISNVNIATSTDLYDRLQETAKGPELRQWCQEVGFLEDGKDFSSVRQRGASITVREVRSFILNFYKGKNINLNEFDNIDTTPIICRTGKLDAEWETLRNDPNLWQDKNLKKVAREFMNLDSAQRNAVEMSKGKIPSVYADKTLNFAILTSWALVAGMLQKNKVRLGKHFELKNTGSKRDPLNAESMAKGRHKSDPENYRGLATRSDSKERGRCVELFYLQAEKGSGITANVIDVAIKRYHKKQANIETLEAEKRI